ncbi:lysozyme [Streptomyces finlayi]|uniref:lysozyme n=2 Tax=Streptomyces finlayi TaxID=67296 RepID=A0A918WXT5_9ACTN|nr:lysozyme [Streptomyces finlayi]
MHVAIPGGIMARDHKPSLRHVRIRALSATAAATAALTLGTTVLLTGPAEAAGQPRGHDVSGHQKNVDWKKAKQQGATFVHVKATESHTYRNPYFAQQYNGSRKAGIKRGAYHFALPHQSSGRAQAAFFVRNGGGWRNDGKTLPPAVDLENNPYKKINKKNKCYGLKPAQMRTWIKSFSDEVRRRTGRRPVIYTTTLWWNDCTGRSTAFGRNHALWLARYNDSPGPLPAGWSYWTIWQFNNARGSLPGDQNLFNGSHGRLSAFTRR